MKNLKVCLSKHLYFLVVKFSVYLYRLVFVMLCLKMSHIKLKTNKKKKKKKKEKEKTTTTQNIYIACILVVEIEVKCKNVVENTCVFVKINLVYSSVDLLELIGTVLCFYTGLTFSIVKPYSS